MSAPSEMCAENAFEDEECERKHFQSIVAAFSHYRNHAMQRVSKTEKFMNTLDPRHRSRLDKYKNYLPKIRWCIEQNNIIIKQIVEDAGDIFENIPSSKMCPAGYEFYDDEEHKQNSILNRNSDGNNFPKNITVQPKTEDVDKVQSILKQLVRDWSSAGAHERAQCYQPIIDEICQEFPSSSNVKVLVPGAGLGRLAFEIATRGYQCQGNEFSLFMLFSSNFVLNKCHKVNGFKVYPWVHQFVNNLSCEYQISEETFPDVDPSNLAGSDFSMIAGDFLSVYTMPNEWNCIATCFFIDCASNVIAFIETIYKILKPGGIWVNLGPLLYHYSDMPNEDSIEPPFDILCDIIADVGFLMEKNKTGVKTKYSQNPHSMLQYEYDSVFFVCRKPAIIQNMPIN